MGKGFEKEYLNHFAIHLKHNTANQLCFNIKQKFFKIHQSIYVSFFFFFLLKPLGAFLVAQW